MVDSVEMQCDRARILSQEMNFRPLHKAMWLNSKRVQIHSEPIVNAHVLNSEMPELGIKIMILEHPYTTVMAKVIDVHTYKSVMDVSECHAHDGEHEQAYLLLRKFLEVMYDR